ncbi:MAG: GNAT family N-acetyltransferase [Deltaproteobacteria bacterium]|nr:GNAT family N-acetyltransferase [Candidatus Zymogenaceae bacterium]
MMTDRITPISPECFPLTPDRWDDFDALFGENRACNGCWCMWWRLTHAEFYAGLGRRNKEAMKRIVDSGEVPGLIAYSGDNPVGWCSVAPRERFGRLNRSPILKRIDDEPVWSVVCFCVHRTARGRGLMRALVSAAVRHAAERGARIVEGYPRDTAVKHYSVADLYVGTVSLFKAAGFVEAARRSPAKPIMRYRVGK